MDGGGFWPKYSLEDFRWSRRDRLIRYLAIPCTCFCDLPMEAIGMHRTDYGDYVIAFDKDSQLAKKLTPLIYVNEDGPLAEMIREKYDRFLSKFDAVDTMPDKKIHFRPTLLDQKKLIGLWDFLPYMKSTVGHTLEPCVPYREGKYAAIWSTKALEEEFEWRYVPAKHRDRIYCFEDYDIWNMGKLAELSERTKDSFLKFSPDEVKAIIVPQEAEGTELIRIHPNFEKIVTTWKKIEDSTIRYRYI
jgi:hypothetical protein